MNVNNSYLTHPGCDLKPAPLAQYERKLKEWHPEDPECHFFQWATQYRNTLKQKGVQPVEVTSRLREITDRMGYIVAEVFRSHEPVEGTIETPLGNINIKTTFSRKDAKCPFMDADPNIETVNCKWVINRDMKLLNEKNGKQLSLTMEQLHSLAYHECPLPPHEHFHPDQVYDFLYAPPLEEINSGFDPNATWDAPKK